MISSILCNIEYSLMNKVLYVQNQKVKIVFNTNSKVFFIVHADLPTTAILKAILHLT